MSIIVTKNKKIKVVVEDPDGEIHHHIYEYYSFNVTQRGDLGIVHADEDDPKGQRVTTVYNHGYWMMYRTWSEETGGK